MKDIHSCNVALIQHHGQLPARAGGARQLGRCPRCWTQVTAPGIPRLWALIQIRWNKNKLYLLFGGSQIWLWADERQWFLSTAEFTQSSFFGKHCFLTTQWVTPSRGIITFSLIGPASVHSKKKVGIILWQPFNVRTWQHTYQLRTRTTKINK